MGGDVRPSIYLSTYGRKYPQRSHPRILASGMRQGQRTPPPRSSYPPTPSALRSPRPTGAGVPTMRPPSPSRAVAFWPTPSVDTSDASWRRERLAGTLAQRQHRLAESRLVTEGDAVAATLIAELSDIDAELLRTRRGSQGLWASRRILVDEIQALRQRVAEQDGLLRQQQERIAVLERHMAGSPRVAGEPRTPQRASEALLGGGRLATPPSRAAVLEARIDSELAMTQAELVAAFRASARTPLTRVP